MKVLKVLPQHRDSTRTPQPAARTGRHRTLLLRCPPGELGDSELRPRTPCLAVCGRKVPSDPLGFGLLPPALQKGVSQRAVPPAAFRGRLPTWQKITPPPPHKTLNHLSENQNYSGTPWIQFNMAFRVLMDTNRKESKIRGLEETNW